MIGVSKIETILKLAIWSGALKGERPLSIMLIAAVGCGKSSLLKKTEQRGRVKKILMGRGIRAREMEVRQVVGSVLYTNNTTPHILCNRYGHLLKSGQIKHIAIPDFLNILNLPRNTYAYTLNFYNSLIEEGILSFESRDTQFVSEVPVTIGLLTAVAKQDFDRRYNDWSNIGFLSRVLPVSFTYDGNTAKAIRESIKHKEYLKDIEGFNIQLPASPQDVTIPAKLADEIEQIALQIRDVNDPLAARPQKQLQILCMARALTRGATVVEEADVKMLRDYKKYFNTQCSARI
jgi:hypothetical protein